MVEKDLEPEWSAVLNLDGLSYDELERLARALRQDYLTELKAIRNKQSELRRTMKRDNEKLNPRDVARALHVTPHRAREIMRERMPYEVVGQGKTRERIAVRRKDLEAYLEQKSKAR